MLHINFLKKKKFSNVTGKIALNGIILPELGDILFFEFVSLDRDVFFRYKFYGLCVGRKKNFLMSLVYLRSSLCGNNIAFHIHLFSSLIFNLRIYSNMKMLCGRSKAYDVKPKVGVYKHVLGV